MRLTTSMTILTKMQWMMPRIPFSQHMQKHSLTNLPSNLMYPTNIPTFQKLSIQCRMINSPRKLKTPIFPTLKRYWSHTRLTNRPSMVVSVYTIMPLNVLILYTAAEEDNTEVQSSAPQEERNRCSTTTHPKTPFPFAKLPFNLLQTDQSDICLFLDIPYNTDPKSITTPSSRIPSSQVFCRQALNQKLAPGFAYLAQLERLNMMAQIPDLGIVLIGNQVGRVGVLTMTRCQAQCQSGFKIEAILPFKNEEDRGLRPTKPLMGMAVGPVQGMERALPGASPRLWGEGEREARRFRLLMMYCDHTVLSYEISRPEGGEDVLVV